MNKPLTALDRLAILIDKDGDSPKCFNCKYYSEWQEHHPYGMGTAAETLWECQANTEEEAQECQRLINEEE